MNRQELISARIQSLHDRNGEPECETCRWWEKFDEVDNDLDEGYCHRRAPSGGRFEPDTPEEVDAQGTWLPFPVVSSFDWCGEHERKKKP